MGLGYQELQVNLMGIETLEETLEVIKQYAESNPDLEWIQGLESNVIENEFPTAKDLDKIVADRPVLSRVECRLG